MAKVESSNAASTSLAAPTKAASKMQEATFCNGGNAKSRSTTFHSYRYVVLLLAALSNALLVFIVSMGIVQDAMVNVTAVRLAELEANKLQLTPLPVQTSDNKTAEPELRVRKDGPFEWNEEIKARNNQAFQITFALVQIFGGNFIARTGAFKLSAVGQMISGLSSILIPFLAYHGYIYVTLLRAILGFGLGFVYPSVYRVVEKWAPPESRDSAISFVQLGSGIGNAASPLIAGILCDLDFQGGWPLVFYNNFILVIIWLALWFAFASDSPETHRKISEKELQLFRPQVIQLTNTSEKEKIAPAKSAKEEEEAHGLATAIAELDCPKQVKIDWCEVLTSSSVWFAIVVYSVYCSTNTFMIFNVSTYFSDHLKFDNTQSGTSVSLMNVGIICSYIFCGLLDRKLSASIEKRYVRKLVFTLGAVVTGIFLIAVTFVPVNYPYLTVAMFISARLFHGFVETQLAGAVFDMAPDFPGVLMGFVNGMSAIFTFTITYSYGMFLDAYMKSLSSWRNLFLINAILLCVSALVFCFLIKLRPIFSSTENGKQLIDEKTKRPTTINSVS